MTEAVVAVLCDTATYVTGLALGFLLILIFLTAIANVGGRFGMSAISDKIGRKAAYHWVCSLGILGAFLCFTEVPILLIVGVLLCEFSYGGNFSCLPSLLAKKFGTSCVSTVHAMTLSGWGMAGIAGPVLANVFTSNMLYLVLALLYMLGFIGFTIFVKKDSLD